MNENIEVNKIDVEVIEENLKTFKKVLEERKDEDFIAIFPPSVYNRLEALTDKLGKLSPNDIKNLDEDLQLTILKLPDYLEQVKYKDMLSKPVDATGLANEIKVEDKVFGISHPTLSTVKNKQSFLIELQEGTGLGKITKIPLWNSGFWITLRPPTNEDIVNLQIALTDEVEKISSMTTNLAFSNITSIFHKVIYDYVVEHISDSSLDVPKKTLIKHISVLDMDTLLLGLLSQIFYNGYDIVLPCKNNVETDEANKPKCNFTLTAKIDFDKLLWVDTARLNSEQFLTMGKRKAKTAKPEDIKAYKKSLVVGVDNKTKVTLMNGKELEIEFNVPGVDTYFNHGDLFVFKLSQAVNKILASDVLKNEKEKAEAVALKTLFLSVYSHFISNMTLGGYKMTDRDGIVDALEVLSSNPKDVNRVIDKINKFITKISITTIGIPEFICPSCNASQLEDDSSGFKRIIPLNMVNYFFSFWTHRYTRLMEEQETI